MLSIRSAVHDFLNPTEIAVVMKQKLELIVGDPLPLDIYSGLGDVGPDRQKIMEMIAEAFKDDGVYPQSLVRHNRLALYKSLHFLRTESSTLWENDRKVVRGEYTEDKLAKRLVDQHPRLIKTVQ
jgi:hypothetical protein